MNFLEFRNSFFSNKVIKKDLVKSIKTLFTDYNSLVKFVNRFEKDLSSAKSLLNQSILGVSHLPKSVIELNIDNQFYTASLQKELNWQVLAFLKCSKIIERFVQLRTEYEHNLLIANYNKSREILDEIEKEICISYWSIENRFIIDENQFGSEKNWETRNDIVDEKNNAFVQILGNMFSVKSENRVSFFQYNEEFNKWQENEGLNISQQYSGLIDYFRFRGNYFSFAKYNFLPEIVYRECDSSIIDRYLLFIRIAQHLITDHLEENYFILQLLGEIGQVINDFSLKQLFLASGIPNIKLTDNFNFEVINILDEYTRGNYIESKNLSKSYILSNSSNYMELYEVYSKSLIEANLEYEPITDVDSFANRISMAYYDILGKKINTDNALVDLVKLSYIYNNSHIGIHLYSFVSEQLGWKSDINYSFLASLNSQFINPKLITNLYNHQDIAKAFLSMISIKNDKSITIKLYSDFLDNYLTKDITKKFEKVSEIKNDLYQIRSLMAKEMVDECIVKCTSLLDNANLSVIAEYETISNLFICFLKKNDLTNCLLLNVNTFLKNPHLTKKMNVDSLLEDIIKGKFKNVGTGSKTGLIELPIFFKINSNDRIKIKQAYELFLIANGFIKPNELLKIKANFEKVKLIYFLKNVCIPEIMQLSKSFDSTYAVNEERISICKFLTEIDNSEENTYKTEIAELTQRNTISKVIGGIDERKVFVNEIKIRQIIKKYEKQNVLQTEQISPLTGESFERYITLLNFVKNNNEYKDVSSIIHFDDKGEMTFIEAEKNKNYRVQDVDAVLYLPAYRIFVTYFLYIRDLFSFSKEYGLDAYLSTRIRHGTLPNHLRSVFETYFLVTSQTNGIYAENQHWKDKFDLSEEDLSKLQKVLGKFSKDIDTFSKEIKDNYIQCQTEKKNINSDALFNYSYAEEDLMWLFLEDFESTVNIDDFIEKSFLELWRRTEVNLEIIRDKFNIDIRDRYVVLIDKLHSDIISFVDKQSVSELINNLMICKTEIQTKLSNISKWFRRSESSYDGEYELQILAETSIQITKNLNPSYHFEIEKNICKNFNIFGEYHQHFIDLINNCLFNIIKHADLPSEHLNAKLTIQESNKNLTLNFENCVSDPAKHVEKLMEIRRNWENTDTNISQEGGTGFPKIKKIIHSDLNRRSSIFDFTFNNNNLSILLSFESTGLKV